MFRRAALAAIFTMAGCAPYDMEVNSAFRPGPGGTFTYMNIADAVYPDGSPEAEQHRMDRLSKYLRENVMCPHGYEITSREAVARIEGLLGTVKDIYYEGRCL
jgi:hypothetical protein